MQNCYGVTTLKNNILTIIPARGGSKGIPRKNLVQLAGKPLLQYTIEAAKSANLGNILLSSDDAEILALGAQLGIKSDYVRPQQFANDTAGMVDVVLHALEWWEMTYRVIPEHVLLLQPTSPLRSSADINAAVAHYLRMQADSLVSVHSLSEHPYECVRIVENKLDFLCKPDKPVVRRQDYDNNFYYINGAIYLTTTKFIKENKKFIDANTSMYVMDRRNGVDIDEPADLQWAEFLLTKN